MHRQAQITFINRYLQQGALQAPVFQTGRFENLITDITRTGTQGAMETFPAIAINAEDYQPIIPDDTYPVQLYHRINNISYAIDRNAVGDNNQKVIERLDMKLVVWVKLTAIKLTLEQLEARLAEGFPDVFPASTLSSISLQSMLVTLTGSNLNSEAVFREEYKGFAPFATPYHTLFSMHYTIESKYRKGCFNTCDPLCNG